MERESGFKSCQPEDIFPSKSELTIAVCKYRSPGTWLQGLLQTSRHTHLQTVSTIIFFHNVRGGAVHWISLSVVVLPTHQIINKSVIMSMTRFRLWHILYLYLPNVGQWPYQTRLTVTFFFWQSPTSACNKYFTINSLHFTFEEKHCQISCINC